MFAVLSLFFVSALCNDDIIRKVNNGQSSWVAGVNPIFEGKSLDEIRGMMGYKPKHNLDVPRGTYSGLALPASFDARKQWANCTTIFKPLNQGQCGSCWAFGATKSFSDRLCIATNGNTDLVLSEQQMVSCNLEGLEACGGGEPVSAMRYIAMWGLPTSECVPYTSGKDGTVPSCFSKCVDGSPFKLYYARLLSLRWHLTLQGIMESIYTEGPVEACFTVYNDFMYYKSGVYTHTTGDELGGHCIVLLGWGTTSDGVDYWIASNSWGNAWGLQGFFWIKRGSNECGIENSVFSIMPSL